MNNFELLNKFYKEDFTINHFYKLVKSGDEDFSLVHIYARNKIVNENVLGKVKNLSFYEWTKDCFIEFN